MINIDEDDEQAVQMMMEYFYHLDYVAPIPQDSALEQDVAPIPQDSALEQEEPSPGGFNDYMDQSSRDVPSRRKRRGKRPVQIEWDPVEPHTSATASRDSNLTLHARVYALGEFYGVAGLKSLALRRFEEEVGMFWDTESFVQAADIAFTSTPDGDKNLRQVVLGGLLEHRSLLTKETWRDLMKTTDGMAYDFVMFLWEKGLTLW